jgi:predicted membrane-bound spermidine synthase
MVYQPPGRVIRSPPRKAAFALGGCLDHTNRAAWSGFPEVRLGSNGLTGEVLKRRAYLLIFILSGFCGLIYESIWTHYLKLFLGHAAYAQTLVLAIFMGGMAVGSWLASRLTPRWSRPLLAYAIVEVLIGLMALVFHRVFVGLTDWSYDTVIPALGGPLAIELWKWGLAALLILPQSVLLGATFPFMSAGLARRFPRDPGRLIAGLYFANSLGAAAGILASGFLLIAWVGLPGTIMTAGLLNIAVALLVYVMVRLEPWTAATGAAATRAAHQAGQPALPVPVGALLLISALTGLASFVYEIGWIRMLSLVLGSSTHAFELMLSAFILGLAIGGFWVRRRVDHFADPLRALAIIQLVMGVLAIGTLVMYQQTFPAMSFAMQALQRTEQGYALFNLFSHSIALAVMLPATICAGMTLPIITWLLMTRGEGEAAIGRVYAANTVGAIAGVVLAVQWLMPVFGLKWLLVTDGLVDIGTGVWLMGTDRSMPRHGVQLGVGGAVLASVLSIILFVPLDIGDMASGVFINGSLLDAEQKVVYHHDGKTATVDVVDHGSTLSIRTNGKIDAGVHKSADKSELDESAMVLSVAIPLMMHPGMRTAAVIGLGSGISTDTLLAYPGLERVDTIEIERGTVEGARHLGPKVQRVFSDPRSAIHIADAKTFFTNHQQSYDFIL